MPTDIPAEDNGRLNGEQALAYLRAAGDHPLMYSFPKGALFAFDHELRYLSAGGHGLADVGLTRETLEGRTIFEGLPQETAAVLEPAYREALTGSTTTSDIEHEGRTYTHLLAPVIDGAGQVVAGLGFTQDVSEARAAERHLRESEERIRLTSVHAPIGQAIVGLDGSWQQVNAAICELTGYSEDQLLQMTFQDITHPDDLDLDLAQVEKLLAGEITSYRMEKRHVTAAGHIVWVLLSGALVRDAEGEPLYFIAQVQDITAERTALRELAAERTLLAEAQRIGQLGSFTTDVRTGESVFSAQVYRIWGLPETADLGGLWASMIHPDDLDRVAQERRDALRGVGGHTSDYRIVRPDGAVRHLRSIREVVLDDAGAPATILGTHLDVTDLALAQDEAVQANTLFASILTASPDLIFVTDVRTGGVVYAAPGKSILGITAEELQELGVSIIATLVHPEEQERLRALNRAALDLADGDVQELVYQARHSDGSWHWLDRRVTPFRRDPLTGQVIEVLGVVRDVDHEHRLALALSESEARFRALVTQVADYAIIGLAPDGAIASWNLGAERLNGYTAEQSAGC